MCSTHLLASVSARLQQITGYHDERFGGLDFIATGDLYQLPPVSAAPVYKPPRETLGCGVLWQSLHYFPLCKVMPQSDRYFSSELTEIGAGLLVNPPETQIESLFRSRR